MSLGLMSFSSNFRTAFPASLHSCCFSLLNAGLENLDGLDRALVEKKYLAGASTRDLASEFGLTERAVESRLLRSRRQLREELLERLKNEETN